MPPSPPTGAQCHVWWLAVPVAPPGRTALGGLLDAAERERCGRLVRSADRDRFTAAHGLLRLVVGLYTGAAPQGLVLASRCPRCGLSDHGKPELIRPQPGAALHVSLSHAGGWVAVAVTRLGPVGVDVEPVEGLAPLVPAELRSARRDAAVLSPREREAFGRLAPADRTGALAVSWTRKEAVLKATGDGLQVSPAALTLTAADAPARLLAWDGRDPLPAVHLQDLTPDARYAGCVAVLADDRPAITEFDGRQLLL